MMKRIAAALSLGVLLLPTGTALAHGDVPHENKKQPCIIKHIDPRTNEMVVKEDRVLPRTINVKYTDHTEFKRGSVAVHENAIPVGTKIYLADLAQVPIPYATTVTINNNQDIYLVDEDVFEERERERERAERRREREAEKRERERERAEERREREFERRMERRERERDRKSYSRSYYDRSVW